MTATRRAILAAAAVLPAWRTRADARLAARGRRLLGLLTNPDAARHVTAAWLAASGETVPHRAAMALNVDTVLAPLDDITDRDAGREFLSARIRADFADGAVVELDGWRLSRTEVGACLLAASAG